MHILMGKYSMKLAGIKVLDLSSVLAGPSVGTFLAELGATVVKIEHPEIPDITRSWKLTNEDKSIPISAYFSSVNYGKSYKQLNLTSAEDYAVFLELLKRTDILLMNFKKGDDVKLGLTKEKLLAQNAQLIIGKITGFGSDADRVAYDLILQAESGIMSMNGTSESGPLKMPIALIDVLAAHHLKEALLLALLEKERTQAAFQGEVVEVSLYRAAISSLANQASNYLMAGHIPQAIGSLHPNIAPYGEIFKTKDKALVTFAIGTNKHFKLLCDWLGLINLASDEKYVSVQKRVENRTVLFEQLQLAVQNYTAEELLSAMAERNVPCAKIKNLKEVFEDEQAKSLIKSEYINGVLTQRVSQIAFE